MHNKMNNWKPEDTSGFFDILNISDDNFVEVGVEDVFKIEREYGVDGYHDILGKYDKVIVSKQTEGYGMSNILQHFYKNFDSNKIFVINDGFVTEKYIDKIYPTIPRENIFYDPILSIWYSWNHVISDCSRILAHSHGRPNVMLNTHTGKINDGFRNIHNNNIDTLCDYESKMDRDFKFIVLNNNYKPGRPQFVDTMTDSFIKENWVSANFFQDEYFWKSDDWKGPSPQNPTVRNPQERDVYKYLRKDDYSKYENDDTGWNSCYEILWTQHLNKAYIQPYWESCAWTDALTEGHYMITEKTAIPFILGNISIPLGIFYVDFLEKMGYQFVKKIGDISINETIDPKDWEGFGWGSARVQDVKNWNYELFDKLNKIEKLSSLSDIKYLYIDNLDIMEHNKQLVKKHMTDTTVIEKLKKWILE